jgi:hypothetical protein
MALIYYAGFSTFETPMGVGVGGPVGTGSLTIPEATYCPGSGTLASITTPPIDGGYTAFASAVQTQLQTVSAGFSCTWDSSTLAYTIAHASSVFTLTFTGTSGLSMRLALGLTGNVAITTSVTSTVRPYYVVGAEIDARSDVTNVYETDDNVEEAVSDGGSPYAVDRDTEELRSDWIQSMEPLEATFIRSATAAVPWTWEHLIKHCRGTFPILVDDGGDLTVHTLRAEGASFSAAVRERVVRDWDGLWNIRLLTRDLGQL